MQLCYEHSMRARLLIPLLEGISKCRRFVARASSSSIAIGLMATLSCGGTARAQQSTDREPPDAALQEQTQQTASPPCVQPAPMLRWQDYKGPFAKIVGMFGRKLERKSVHPLHYKPGAILCTLELKDKFILFVEETFDPVTFLNAGFNAGISQAENNEPAFGQGATGYGKRFGANFVSQASSQFFKDFAYPAIFSEDPRYYRLGHGASGRRLLHAAEHAFVAHRENGRTMLNFSEWFGTTSAVVLSNLYYPDNRRGFAPAAQRVGYGVAGDVGFDVLREFWPEIARKFKLPFRDQHESEN
jgi:hypothetical protein